MPVLVGCQASRPASSFISWDTDASPQSGTFHTRDRWAQSNKTITYDKKDWYYIGFEYFSYTG
jgi:hypothetical protein